jgi:phosphoserine phosphatase
VKSGLLLMDMDSTLINEEGIDLLAAEAGLGETVANITAAAMSGNRNFYESLTDRVTLLSGQPEMLFDQVRRSLTFTPGALELIRSLQDQDWVIGVVSGGFHDIIDPFLEPLQLNLVRANRFEIHDERLTGQVIPPIIGPREKAQTLNELAAKFSIPTERCVAIGDGANDREMIQAAGIGIAFCAKPALEELADHSIQARDLSLVLDLLQDLI